MNARSLAGDVTVVAGLFVVLKCSPGTGLNLNASSKQYNHFLRERKASVDRFCSCFGYIVFSISTSKERDIRPDH